MNLRSSMLAGLILLALSRPGLAQQDLSPKQMEDDVRQFFASVRDRYSYVDEKKDQHGVDLEKMERAAIARCAKVQGNAEFHELLQEMVAGLKDGHCSVHANHLAAAKTRSWPVVLQLVKEGVLITSIDKSVAGMGFGPGDLLREVNDRPIDAWIKNAEQTTPASTDLARRRIALQLMGRTAKESVKLRVEHGNGTSSTHSVNTASKWMHFPAVPGRRDLDPGIFLESTLSLTKDLGYIRFSSFKWGVPMLPEKEAEINERLKSAWEQIDAAFKLVEKTKALVLDLRGNTGGWDAVATRVAFHLVPGDFRYYTVHTRHQPNLLLAMPRKSFQCKVYPGRVAVLIDEASFSATDNLAAALKDLRPDFKFVGRPTHAGTGGPKKAATLKHSNAEVWLCSTRVWSPKGRLIEGCSTTPHVQVEWTREDVMKKRDADVDAAKKVLQFE